MKVNDQSQNLPIRIGALQIIAFILLSLLGARLYYLQIVKGDYYKDKAESQRIRKITLLLVSFDQAGTLHTDFCGGALLFTVHFCATSVVRFLDGRRRCR